MPSHRPSLSRGLRRWIPRGARRREGRKTMREARLFLVQGGTPHEEVDDATLVHKLVDRHPDAARLIWQRFAPMVHRILRRSFGPDEDVEDLAQEVFMCVFQKASSLREPQ